jgi:hypothetical protein
LILYIVLKVSVQQSDGNSYLEEEAELFKRMPSKITAIAGTPITGPAIIATVTAGTAIKGTVITGTAAPRAVINARASTAPANGINPDSRR